MEEILISSEHEKNLEKKIYSLILLYREGKLGGDVMPEDSNPGLLEETAENYVYFTLPMALNYQRNSYGLWEAAKKTFMDKETKDVFDMAQVCNMDDVRLREKLTRYSLALQPNKQPIIWRKLCETFVEDYDGDIRVFFEKNDFCVNTIKADILRNKKRFPYLSGEKIMNYWLYVMEQYTNACFVDRNNICIAPDTHIIKSCIKLGVINETDTKKEGIRKQLNQFWNQFCESKSIVPIDIHTPLWLWSRNGFQIEP